MLISNHKAFTLSHISAPLIWTWCTADLLLGTVFSDTSLVGKSQCILTDMYAVGWDCYATVVFPFTVEVWVAFVLPVHISCKSMSSTCPQDGPLQMIPHIKKDLLENMACQATLPAMHVSWENWQFRIKTLLKVLWQCCRLIGLQREISKFKITVYWAEYYLCNGQCLHMINEGKSFFL